MLAGFAIVAATIAVLGIYGVTAYSVQQRERELAIRLALGAGRRAIASLFLRESGGVLVGGLVAGLGGAVAVARVLEHQIFGVQRFDASMLAVTSALMAVTGLIATWWPARRASHKDPAISLRDI
jgi:ABC-type antimicrobial peptide transport system permease subunit